MQVVQLGEEHRAMLRMRRQMLLRMQTQPPPRAPWRRRAPLGWLRGTRTQRLQQQTQSGGGRAWTPSLCGHLQLRQRLLQKQLRPPQGGREQKGGEGEDGLVTQQQRQTQRRVQMKMQQLHALRTSWTARAFRATRTPRQSPARGARAAQVQASCRVCGVC